MGLKKINFRFFGEVQCRNIQTIAHIKGQKNSALIIITAVEPSVAEQGKDTKGS